MQSKRSAWGVIFLVALFILQGTSQLAFHNEPIQTEITENNGIEWVSFELKDGVYHDAVGTYDNSTIKESREVVANTILGTFSESGLELSRPISAEFLQPRDDLLLVLIDSDINLLDARARINDLEGLVIREYISPSGLVVQGAPTALEQLALLENIAAIQNVPVALIIEPNLLDVLLLQGSEQSLLGERVRLEGWRGENGLEQTVSLSDGISEVKQDLQDVVNWSITDEIMWDSGRFEGDLTTANIIELASQPALKLLRFNPVFQVHNNNAGSHMKSNSMQIYFTTDLDGSGQTVAVADSGLDEDHGDFGSRVVANNDVINDGSTADRWSGHGTHVSCTVLGDGNRGGYSGVAPAADLYFQAMENDNTGNFQSPSLNSLLNSAYSAGARTHTNSWGNSGGFGEYSSESQDVDDRANYYDRYYSGGEGLTILFAAGNDGPDSDTITPPSTAKNAVTVGMHQNRYQGAPDFIMEGSSRGPLDDGRIKPDILAPGGYVRSCRAQEAADTGGSSWSSTWYLEYTGTSMATPNAAGAAAMIREYLEEIALRQSPQGALVKALLILGAEDIGARDIPNNDEGWGRVNLRNSLAPPDGQGVWVDDRSLLSATGNSKSYTFDIDSAGDQFKAVLAWSDEYASTWSSTQLVTNLNLEITDPNGLTYLGNDFANGRSTTGGSADSLNNVEVVLIDSAIIGTWTVEVIDANHGGSRSQPFSLAVMGNGINDLKPDLVMIESGYSIDITIPSVGQETELICLLENTGNIRSDPFAVTLEVNGVELNSQSMELSGGADRELVWSWTPQTSGENLVSFIIDKDELVVETLETNNRLDVIVNVSEPGVAITSAQQNSVLQDAKQTSTTWQVSLQNTGLLPTNASIAYSTILSVNNGTEMDWYVGLSGSDYSLEGRESTDLTVTVLHQEAPLPGTYQIILIGQDLDNGISTQYYVELSVGEIPDIEVTTDYDIVPVHPIEPTSVPIYLFNTGNTEIAYDLQVQSPNGWDANFIQDFTPSQFATSPLVEANDFATLEMVIEPPSVVPNSGYQTLVTLSVTSKTSPAVNWLIELPIEVDAVKSVQVRSDTPVINLQPNSQLVMVFAVENKGNLPVKLSPTFILPQGVQVISSTGIIDLAVGESEIYLTTLQLSSSAKSGQAQVHFDNGSDRFTWSDYLEVQIYPKPSLSFEKVIYPDGQEYSATFFGSGSHPAGAELQFIWTLTNDADVQWQPVVSAVSDPKLSVACGSPELIGYQESTQLTCNVLTSSESLPFSEPSFTLEFAGAGTDYSEQFSLYIGGYEQVSWSELSLNNFTEGEVQEVQILVTNTGTLPFNYVASFDSNKDWKVEVIGDGIVDLEVGESRTLKFTVKPTSSGLSDLTIQFTGMENSAENNYRFTANAQDSPSEGAALGIPATQIGIILAVILLVVIIGLVILKPSNRQQIAPPMMPFIQPQNVIAQPKPPIVNFSVPPIQPAASSQVATPAPICWNCRKPVEGKVVGCPQCGARYHAESTDDCDMASLKNCLSCQSPSSTFVSE